MTDITATHWQPLVGWLAGIVGNRAAAEDIAQEALLRLWRREGEWVVLAAICLVIKSSRSLQDSLATIGP